MGVNPGIVGYVAEGRKSIFFSNENEIIFFTTFWRDLTGNNAATIKHWLHVTTTTLYLMTCACNTYRSSLYVSAFLAF